MDNDMKNLLQLEVTISEATNSDYYNQSETQSLSSKDLTGIQWLLLLLKKCPTEPMELSLGLGTALWGLWISLPWWSVCDLSPKVYAVLLLAFRDEFILGVGALILGLCTCLAVVHDRPALRYWCVVCLTSEMGVYCLCFLFSDYRHPGFLWWGLYTVEGWWLMSRNGRRCRAILAQKRLQSQDTSTRSKQETHAP